MNVNKFSKSCVYWTKKASIKHWKDWDTEGIDQIITSVTWGEAIEYLMTKLHQKKPTTTTKIQIMYKYEIFHWKTKNREPLILDNYYLLPSVT